MRWCPKKSTKIPDVCDGWNFEKFKEMEILEEEKSSDAESNAQLFELDKKHLQSEQGTSFRKTIQNIAHLHSIVTANKECGKMTSIFIHPHAHS